MRFRLILGITMLLAGIALADYQLVLQAGPGAWRPGSYRDITVLAMTEDVPLGAARFDILVTNTQAVRHVAVFGDQVMASGGLVPISDAAPGAATSLTRVASFNAMRPDVPFATCRVATLRFQVIGEPGDSCTIILTNAELWSTAALPTNESAAIAPCRLLPLATKALEYPLEIAGAVNQTLGLAGAPTHWIQGRLYPVRLVADSASEMLSGFDATIHFSPNALEVIDVLTADRECPVMWSCTTGIVRALGVKSGTLRGAAGVQDLATIWVAVRDTTPASAEETTVKSAHLLTGPALQSHTLRMSAVTSSIQRVSPPQRARFQPPPQTNVFLNNEFETPVAVEVPAWTPWLIGGWFSFDPSKVIVVDIQRTGLLAGASFFTDTNMFASGVLPFVWYDFSRSETETSGVLNLLNVRWRVTGGTLEQGTMLCTLTLADGFRNGFDTAVCISNVAFIIRFSPTDMDGDGIPDWWAIQYYGGETNVVAGSDTDGDSFTALEEYLSGTVPTNPASFLHVISLAQASNGVAVSWAGVTGITYTLTRSTNLIWNSPELVAGGIEGAVPVTIIQDTNALPDSPLFYRVTVP